MGGKWALAPSSWRQADLRPPNSINAPDDWGQSLSGVAAKGSPNPLWGAWPASKLWNNYEAPAPSLAPGSGGRHLARGHVNNGAPKVARLPRTAKHEPARAAHATSSLAPIPPALASGLRAPLFWNPCKALAGAAGAAAAQVAAASKQLKLTLSRANQAGTRPAPLGANQTV